MKRILIIEDDPAIRLGLSEALTADGYDVITAADGAEGEAKAVSPAIDLIILDIMLPRKNGIDVCKSLRKQNINTLLLMLTSKNEEIDIVLGLDVGADDYMTKPFSLRELKARITALLRRNSQLKTGIETLQFSDVTVDFTKQEVHKNGVQIKLSTKEFHILKFFAEHIGQIVTRDMLLDAVWGYSVFPTTRTVDNYILSLRKKLEIDPSKPRHILTAHTSGYKFQL